MTLAPVEVARNISTVVVDNLNILWIHQGIFKTSQIIKTLTQPLTSQ